MQWTAQSGRRMFVLLAALPTDVLGVPVPVPDASCILYLV